MKSFRQPLYCTVFTQFVVIHLGVCKITKTGARWDTIQRRKNSRKKSSQRTRRHKKKYHTHEILAEYKYIANLLKLKVESLNSFKILKITNFNGVDLKWL